jgi:hypothetical protein
MQAQVDYLHNILDVVTPLAMAAFTIVGLIIKGKMGEVSLSNEKAASQLRADLLEHNTQVAKELAVHQAEDRGNFDRIQESLRRIEQNGKRGG